MECEPLIMALEFAFQRLFKWENFPSTFKTDAYFGKLEWKADHPLRMLKFYCCWDAIHLILHLWSLCNYATNSFEIVLDIAYLAGYYLGIVGKVNTILQGKDVCNTFNAMSVASQCIIGRGLTTRGINISSVKASEKKNVTQVIFPVRRPSICETLVGIMFEYERKLETRVFQAKKLKHVLVESRKTKYFYLVFFVVFSTIITDLICIALGLLFIIYSDSKRFIYGWIPTSFRFPGLLLAFSALELFHYLLIINHLSFYVIGICVFGSHVIMLCLDLIEQREKLTIKERLTYYSWIRILIGRANVSVGLLYTLHIFGLLPLHLSSMFGMIKFSGNFHYVLFVGNITAYCAAVPIIIYGMADVPPAAYGFRATIMKRILSRKRSNGSKDKGSISHPAFEYANWWTRFLSKFENLNDALVLLKKSRYCSLMYVFVIIPLISDIMPIVGGMTFLVYSDRTRYVYGWIPAGFKSPVLLTAFTAIETFHYYILKNHLLFYVECNFISLFGTMEWLKQLNFRRDTRNIAKKLKCYSLLRLYVGGGNSCMGMLLMFQAIGLIPVHVATNFVLIKYPGKIWLFLYGIVIVLSGYCMIVSVIIYGMTGVVTLTSS
ncbi:unnamed protein product, partial [Allacma fusca]